MKKLFLALLLSAMSFGAMVAQSGMKSYESELFAPRRKSGNRTFGLGLNYTYPASGLSARFAFTDNVKGQVTFNRRGYGAGVSWTNIGAELNYCFEEKNNLSPFLYFGVGRGSINYDDGIFGTIDNYSWFGWNLGGGLEWFPKALGGDLGINWTLGVGSYGSYGLSAATTTGLLYGGGIHYYFK